MELMDHFLSPRAEDEESPSEEGVRRELLESAVACVALVEVGADGVKFVRLRAEGSLAAAMPMEECNGNVEEAARDGGSSSSGVNGNPDSRGQTGEREALCVGTILKWEQIEREMDADLPPASADCDDFESLQSCHVVSFAIQACILTLAFTTKQTVSIVRRCGCLQYWDFTLQLNSDLNNRCAVILVYSN